MPRRYKKVVILGLDGLEPTILDALLARGEMPNLARLTKGGGVKRVATTCPAQTPVAWSSFATGVNPGGHGIFDFVHRDPKTYLPTLAFNRYEQKNMFTPPKAVNLRRGNPVWSRMAAAGVPSVILRCPCTYPPENSNGRMLAGMGVPDLVGGLGTSSFHTTEADVAARESETIVPIGPLSAGVYSTQLMGPRKPKSRDRAGVAVKLRIDASNPDQAVLESPGTPRELRLTRGEWSPWLKLKFPVAPLVSVRGMVRLLLLTTNPEVRLYVSPVNFDPASPLFPISAPPSYAQELESSLGTYYTTGMVEDHGGLNNERIDEDAFLDQCHQVFSERERMWRLELSRQREGLIFCLFDTPDRLQHMMWRGREPDHPANRGRASIENAHAIEEHYRECDGLIGRTLEFVDDSTLFVTMSDHGFGSFRRGLHINGWLHQAGLLHFKPGHAAGPDCKEIFEGVDWSRSKAYAYGLGSIYLNRRDREGHGIVTMDEADGLEQSIIDGLAAVRDPSGGETPVTRVVRRRDVYSGEFASEAPDLVVQFSRGYRASWATGLGGVPTDLFEENTKKWSGDHIVAPELVPGFIASNNALADGASLVDLAPTILSAFGTPLADDLEGRSLLL